MEDSVVVYVKNIVLLVLLLVVQICDKGCLLQSSNFYGQHWISGT